MCKRGLFGISCTRSGPDTDIGPGSGWESLDRILGMMIPDVTRDG